MQALNLPTFDFRVIDQSGKRKIFDPLRKKYLALTPEEWVRQHFIQFLVIHKHFPKGLLMVESAVKYHQRSGRYDALFLGTDAKPLMLIECKAPTVRITQETFDQLSRYNTRLKAPYACVTNGLTHFCIQIDTIENKLIFLKDIPAYQYLAANLEP